MKKVMSLVLLMIISFTLTACDGLIDNTPENEAPEVIGDSYIIFQKGSPEPDWRDYADATDPEDGAIRITNAMIDTNDLDMNKEGIYEVDIYVTDSDGKSSLFVITVQIQDDRDVELTLIGDEEITIEVGEVYDELGAVARYVGAENIDYTINGTVDTNVLGSYVIEYVVEVKDLKIARLVHVVDNQSPMITLGDFMHVYVLKDSEYNDFPLYIEDNYDVELNTTMMGYPNTAVEGV